MVGERYHIQAWGSPDHPDLDYRTDNPPYDLGWKYPYISVARLHPITKAEIDAMLDAYNLANPSMRKQ